MSDLFADVMSAQDARKIQGENMNKAEKLASLNKYAQNLRDRLASKNFPKRDNTQFLTIDLRKTEQKIDKLKMEVSNDPASKK